MNRLPSVIGPAPSELSIEDFIVKLRAERQRVVQALHDFKIGYSKKPKTKKKAKSKIDPELKAMMEEYGMSMDDVIEFAKGLKRGVRAG